MPHFYTVTANLLWEVTLNYHDWEEGQAVRAENYSAQAAGKGVNVARTLRKLEAAGTALIFPGGATGRMCEESLIREELSFKSFGTEAATRYGFVVRASGKRETTFLGPDSVVGRAAIESCSRYIEKTDDGGITVVCGSIPGWEGDGWDSLREALKGRFGRTQVVVDTYGPALAWFVKQPVTMVKINRREFEQLIGRELHGAAVTRELLKIAGDSPVRNWVITDGPYAVRMLDSDGRFDLFHPEEIETVYPTGCGDVLLGAMLHAIYNRGYSVGDSISYALPFAASNARSEAVAEFDLENNISRS